MFREMQDYYQQQQAAQTEKYKVRERRREDAMEFLKKLEREKVSKALQTILNVSPA